MSEKMTYTYKRYHKLKDEGLCVGCGKNPAIENELRCEACKTEYKKVMQFRKEKTKAFEKAGLCKVCGKNEPLIGLKLCYKCSERLYLNNCKHFGKSENRQKHNKQRQDRRAKFIALNLCAVCGGTLDDKKYKTCSKCRKNQNERSKAYKARKIEGTGRIPRSERTKYGLCYVCGDQAEEGKGLCNKCISKRHKFTEEERKTSSETFRKLNKGLKGERKT